MGNRSNAVMIGTYGVQRRRKVSHRQSLAATSRTEIAHCPVAFWLVKLLWKASEFEVRNWQAQCFGELAGDPLFNEGVAACASALYEVYSAVGTTAYVALLYLEQSASTFPRFR